jgi:hypothetical protein
MTAAYGLQEITRRLKHLGVRAVIANRSTWSL